MQTPSKVDGGWVLALLAAMVCKRRALLVSRCCFETTYPAPISRDFGVCIHCVTQLQQLGASYRRQRVGGSERLQ